MLALGPPPPNGPTPANVQATALTLPLKLLHRVGETLAAAQVEAILTGRIVLPVTARTDTAAIHGEPQRSAAFGARSLASRSDLIRF